MAVTFRGDAVLTTTTTVTTLTIATLGTGQIDDIYIAVLINKSATANAISPPDGTWTEIAQGTNTGGTGGHQYAIFWKRATVAGSQNFTFSKATDDNVLFAGNVQNWRGCPQSGSPLDATAVGTTQTTASTDNVSFPAFDPTRTDTHVVFIAFYGNDLTTFAAAMSSDTDPDCTKFVDDETSQGTDATIAGTSGYSSGANIAARTWASVSNADAANTGVVFALVPEDTVQTSKTQTALARITDTVDKTQTALARITNTVDQTQTAKANISAGVQTSKTQTAVARITDTVDKTQTALARITDQVSQTQSAVARITDTVDKTQTALARITVQATKTQTALARITDQVEKTQTALARLINTVDQTQTAKAFIGTLPAVSLGGYTSYNYVIDGAFTGVPVGGEVTPEVAAAIARGDRRFMHKE